MRINRNVNADIAYRNMSKNNKELGESLERLSSGMKINNAADGPASLVISEYMRSQIAGLDQAAANNESAVTMVQTAEGALNEVASLLIDVRQRAVAAANSGVNDDAMREASQEEIENALNAIDRIAATTQFGRKNLLDGSMPKMVFQVGENAGDTVEIDMPNISTRKLAFEVNRSFTDEPVRRKFGNEDEYKAAFDAYRSEVDGHLADNADSFELNGKVYDKLENSSDFSSLADIDVTTDQGAQDTMHMTDLAIAQIATLRGELGAFQKNTLESNLSSLTIASENLSAAESVIRDADIAAEMANFTRNQIMSQSATSQLAQANALPQNVLRLIS